LPGFSGATRVVELLTLAAGAIVVCAVLTYLVVRRARRTGLVDVPNERSSHQVPTPTGGGAAIVVTVTAGFVVLFLSRLLPPALFVAGCAGVVVAAAGFWDDRYRLPASARLLVHLLAALIALWVLGSAPAVRVGEGLWQPLQWLGYALVIFGIIWAINLFNFMDGIDGIAASQAIFMTCAAAIIGPAAGTTGMALRADLLLGAACTGFALWNWPPARIFMGDVGSGYIGFLLAVMVLAAMHVSDVALWIWLTLGAVFVIDTTVTLARRLLRGERVHEAHRSHAYQWLARRWGSHQRTTLTVVCVNVAWLLPCAWLESVFPRYAAALTLLAWLPVLALVMAAGAGRREFGAATRAAGAAGAAQRGH
jgi:Fuc2NAc and GlcNAc transferase